jgi:hypothetical protein
MITAIQASWIEMLMEIGRMPKKYFDVTVSRAGSSKANVLEAGTVPTTKVWTARARA